MKKNILSLIFATLLLPQALWARLPSTEPVQERALHELQKKFEQFKRTMQCLRGAEGCSPEEINAARVLVAEIAGVVSLFAVGAVYLVKRRKFEQYVKDLEAAALPKNSKIAVDYLAAETLFPIYVQRRNVTGIQNILALPDIGLTDKNVEDIKTSFAGYQAQTKELYNALDELVRKNNLAFLDSPGLSSRQVDEKLMTFFKKEHATENRGATFLDYTGMSR